MAEGKKHEIKKYAPPFSVRLTLAERARLDAEAGQLPIGEYVRMQLFDKPDVRQRVYRRPVQDAEALVEVLAALGNSRMTGNLYQIVRAVHAGELAVTAEQQKDLEEALVNVRDMRQWLMAALGLQAEGKNGLKDGGGLRPPENAPPAPVGDVVSGSGGGGI
ncbi:MAG: hypothetical protein PSY14_11250 [bacterium]|nr:hypothetical protein [bacterium]